MLRWRLVSAGIILSVLLGLMVLDARQVGTTVGGVWLAPVLLAMTVLGTNELLYMLGRSGHRPVAWPIYVGNVAIVLASLVPMFGELTGWTFHKTPLGSIGLPLCMFGIATAAVFTAEMARYKKPGDNVLNVACGMLTLGYVGVLHSFIAALRLFDMDGRGLVALVSMILAVKVCDTGAYFTGRLASSVMKTHKMTPRLSPGKTWEGAVGGLTATVVASWAFFQYVAPWMIEGFAAPPAWASLSYGLLLGVLGMLGDLAESLIKRDTHCKDSSTWLPGLGGVLDIADSMLLAAPVAYLCWALGMFGKV